MKRTPTTALAITVLALTAMPSNAGQESRFVGWSYEATEEVGHAHPKDVMIIDVLLEDAPNEAYFFLSYSGPGGIAVNKSKLHKKSYCELGFPDGTIVRKKLRGKLADPILWTFVTDGPAPFGTTFFCHLYFKKTPKIPQWESAHLQVQHRVE